MKIHKPALNLLAFALIVIITASCSSKGTKDKPVELNADERAKITGEAGIADKTLKAE